MPSPIRTAAAAIVRAAIMGANHMSQPRMPAPTGIAARHILALQLATPVSEAFQRYAMPLAIFALRQSAQRHASKPPTPQCGQAIRRKLGREDRFEIGVNPIRAHVMEVANIGPGERRELEIPVAALGKLRVE